MDAAAAALLDELLENAQSGEKDDSTTPHPDAISFKKLQQDNNDPNDDILNNITDIADRGPVSNNELQSFLKLQTGNQTTDPDDDDAGLNLDNDPTLPTKEQIYKLFAIRRRIRTNILTMDTSVDLMTPNGTVESILDWSKKAKLDKRQRRAFSYIIAHFILTFYDDADNTLDTISGTSRLHYTIEKRRLQRLVIARKNSTVFHKQMLMFLHGPGGSGKSTVINLVLKYAEMYCENLEFPFTKNTIMITAMSGVAATILHGRTTHSSCCMERRPKDKDFMAWKDTRMLIIDEVSFCNQDDFETLDIKLRLLKNRPNDDYGGIHVIFAGDFRQLDPVGQDPIHVTGCVNCYIELDGMHQFSKDKEWGKLLMRFRNGTITPKDIQYINQRCIASMNPARLPNGIQYASYDNKTRDKVNNAMFERYVKGYVQENGRPPPDAVLVFMDELYRIDGNQVKVPIRSKKTFWENCSEDDIKTGKRKPRIDSVLKLFYKCPVMLTHNADVEAAQANGTCALVEQITLKHGETPFQVRLDDGTPVHGVLVGQVQHLQLHHCDPTMSPAVFNLESNTFSFKTTWPIPEDLCFSSASGKPTETISMQGRQFACVMNHATTGHKLQGQTVSNIFICNWNYKVNWPYVVLSRVKTIKGLFLQRPLNTDISKYAMPQSYIDFIRGFRNRETEYFELGDYDDIISSR